MIIYLVGISCVGKTTIGRLLAEKPIFNKSVLCCPFSRLDRARNVNL